MDHGQQSILVRLSMPYQRYLTIFLIVVFFKVEIANTQPSNPLGPPASSENRATQNSLEKVQRIRLAGWLSYLAFEHLNSPESGYSDFFRSEYQKFRVAHPENSRTLEVLLGSFRQSLLTAGGDPAHTTEHLTSLRTFSSWFDEQAGIDPVRLGLFFLASGIPGFSLADDKQLAATNLETDEADYLWYGGIRNLSVSFEHSKSKSYITENNLIGARTYWAKGYTNLHTSDEFTNSLLLAKASPTSQNIVKLLSFLDIDLLNQSLQQRFGAGWKVDAVVVPIPGRISTELASQLSKKIAVPLELVFDKSLPSQRQSFQPNLFARLRNAWSAFLPKRSQVNATVSNKLVILFDDLFTTGASVTSAAYKMRMSPMPPKDIVILTVGHSA